MWASTWSKFPWCRNPKIHFSRFFLMQEAQICCWPEDFCPFVLCFHWYTNAALGGRTGCIGEENGRQLSRRIVEAVDQQAQPSWQKQMKIEACDCLLLMIKSHTAICQRISRFFPPHSVFSACCVTKLRIKHSHVLYNIYTTGKHFLTHRLCKYICWLELLHELQIT